MNSYRDYDDAVIEAATRATRDGLDVAIRKCKEYGRIVFNVSYASRNDSDYARAEIITPQTAPLALAAARSVKARKENAS